jgi:hypothetical protein
MSRRLADGKDFLAAAPDSFGLIGQGWFLYYIPSGVSADNIRPFFHRVFKLVLTTLLSRFLLWSSHSTTFMLLDMAAYFVGQCSNRNLQDPFVSTHHAIRVILHL